MKKVYAALRRWRPSGSYGGIAHDFNNVLQAMRSISNSSAAKLKTAVPM